MDPRARAREVAEESGKLGLGHLAAGIGAAALPSASLSLIAIADALNNDPSTVAGKLQEAGLNAAVLPTVAGTSVLGGMGGVLASGIGIEGHPSTRRGLVGGALGALALGAVPAVPLGMYMLNDGSGGGQPAQQAQAARTARA